ncbi:uncharacterized protein [Solanum tuberosum]|uniref:Uncharacterized protein n=1 Tax=Solanum tuberosum TaxID=4113 RepID=M1C5R6_SOLTU|nr:PREDICTED: uncharacterized protein LOC102603825 isoform X4 [Solanum tuberosum]
MDGEKTVYFPVDEEKAVSFPVDEVKEVCSPVDEIMYFPFPINGGGEEIAVSPRSRDDMTVFEIRGFTSCVYNGRLLRCTGYFYIISHFMRRAYDISGKDVMLGLAMQTFCFMANGMLFVRAIALSFCFGISIYRYVTYSTPPALPRPKMELLPY